MGGTGRRRGGKVRSKPLSNSLRNRIIREVRALCHHAQATRRITYNAADGIKPFKVAEFLKPTFSIAELREMVSPAHRADPWWLPACLSAYTGCRIREAMHLRWQDIDWPSSRIRVRLQDEYDQKNNQEREVPLQVELRAILHPMAKPAGFIIEDPHMRANGSCRHLLNPKHQPVERKDETIPIHPDFTPRLCGYLRRIGIKPGLARDRRTAHSLRHGWIALMLVTGEPASLVARWAGHGKDVQDDYADSVGRYSTEARVWPRGEFYLQRDVAAEATATKAAS